jgi:hypothetical protein
MQAVVELPFDVWKPIEIKTYREYEVFRKGKRIQVKGNQIEVGDNVRHDGAWKKVISFQ